MDIKRPPKSKLKKKIRTAVMIVVGVAALGGITYGLTKLKPAAPTLDPSTAVIDTVKRGEMVRGMVARLAERLKTDGSDVEGWLRLVRAYVVLGERDKASEAVGSARRALASDPDKVHRIEDFAKSVGLSG